MFTRSDFDIFNDPTLAGRMHLIKTVIDPKFEAAAPTILQTLATASAGGPFYAHVAKHLRRVKNPPVDTWVAFSQNKRSYKAWPHFELGLWPDRLFIYFDVLDECKPQVQARLSATELLPLFQQLPADFVVSHNHGAPTTKPATPSNVAQLVTKFDQYKHSELVAGRSVLKTDAVMAHPEQLEALVLETFETLMLIYQPIMAAVTSTD